MTDKICYWDDATQSQRERDADEFEQAEINARRAAADVPVVPRSVTRRQARQALLLAGLLDKVQPAIDAIPDPTARGMAQIEWDDSQAYERDRPMLIQIGTALNLDAAGLDQLFIQAASL